MDDGTLAARHAASHRAFYAAMTATMPGGRVLALEGGVQAAIAPAVPLRSLFNAVVYVDGAALLARRDALADAYASAGVTAWTVWVRPGDDAVAAALRDAGHALDGRPPLMGADLAEIDLEPHGASPPALDAPPTGAAVAAVNDAAYGVPPDRSFLPALGGLHTAPVRAWAIAAGGRPACVLITAVHEQDCYVAFVATHPEHRGRGLASALLRTALRHARDEAGATSTTLEATALGAPVYERLGYRRLGELTMWEHRRR